MLANTWTSRSSKTTSASKALRSVLALAVVVVGAGLLIAMGLSLLSFALYGSGNRFIHELDPGAISLWKLAVPSAALATGAVVALRTIKEPVTAGIGVVAGGVLLGLVAQLLRHVRDWLLDIVWLRDGPIVLLDQMVYYFAPIVGLAIWAVIGIRARGYSPRYIGGLVVAALMVVPLFL